MKDYFDKDVFNLLKGVIRCNPMIEGRDQGQCVYCGVALDEGETHLLGCTFEEAKRLMRVCERRLNP